MTSSDGADAAPDATATPNHPVAALKVFGTTELLEQILLELPLRSLFPMMRVSSVWKATINGSVKIQRALFLQPCIRGIDPEDFSFPEEANNDLSPVISDLHEHILASAENGSHTLNPLARVIFHHKYRDNFEYHHFESVFNNNTTTASSWRTMLVIQPPVKTVNVYLKLFMWCRKMCPEKRESYSLKDMLCTNEAGLTLGDIAETMGMMREAALPLLRNEDDGEDTLEFGFESLFRLARSNDE